MGILKYVTNWGGIAIIMFSQKSVLSLVKITNICVIFKNKYIRRVTVDHLYQTFNDAIMWRGCPSTPQRSFYTPYPWMPFIKWVLFINANIN